MIFGVNSGTYEVRLVHMINTLLPLKHKRCHVCVVGVKRGREAITPYNSESQRVVKRDAQDGNIRSHPYLFMFSVSSGQPDPWSIYMICTAYRQSILIHSCSLCLLRATRSLVYLYDLYGLQIMLSGGGSRMICMA